MSDSVDSSNSGLSEDNDRIIQTDLRNEMSRSYLEYAMSVIVGRALPDARDGLKPVHRRILYAMYELGLTSGRPYRKCARVVGEVLGKYHPPWGHSCLRCIGENGPRFLYEDASYRWSRKLWFCR